ncbi:MAG: tRNA pseudouridine(38-40) synthase TruA [Muribaculaceae bacterium]|nr:tRNA pseudouridine(38-40) synthase TruA [Muribaculaceae bacterium]
MRFFLRLSYNGTNFHGWQSQPNALGVQQVIEEALSTMTRLPIQIVGAGRTDTGVHAREMFAHFDLPEDIQNKEKFILSLNRLIGKDIAVHDILRVPEDAHARFDASKRTYKYFVTFDKNCFLYRFCWHSPSLLDKDRMNEAAEILLETSDFTSFAKLHSDAKTNICDVNLAKWESWVNEFGVERGLVFTISADRFLRNMVRAIVGTLVDVGRNKINLSEFQSIIEKKDRCSAGISMPASGLFLWEIKYPFFTN